MLRRTAAAARTRGASSCRHPLAHRRTMSSRCPRMSSSPHSAPVCGFPTIRFCRASGASEALRSSATTSTPPRVQFAGIVLFGPTARRTSRGSTSSCARPGAVSTGGMTASVIGCARGWSKSATLRVRTPSSTSRSGTSGSRPSAPCPARTSSAPPHRQPARRHGAGAYDGTPANRAWRRVH